MRGGEGVARDHMISNVGVLVRSGGLHNLEEEHTAVRMRCTIWRLCDYDMGYFDRLKYGIWRRKAWEIWSRG